MAAHHHLSGQLAMFLPAKELVSYNPNPWDYSSNPQHAGEEDSLWSEKLDESEALGYTESVAKAGVRSPVNIYHGPAPKVLPTTDLSKPHIANGHHRIISAHEHDPESLVPVRHYDEGSRSRAHPARDPYMHATWDEQE